MQQGPASGGCRESVNGNIVLDKDVTRTPCVRRSIRAKRPEHRSVHGKTLLKNFFIKRLSQRENRTEYFRIFRTTNHLFFSDVTCCNFSGVDFDTSSWT